MKLSNKLSLTVILSAVVLVPILGFSIFYSSSRIIRKLIMQSELALARTIMSTIDRRLYQAQQDIRGIAEDELIEQWMESLDQEMITEDAKKLEDRVNRALMDSTLLTGPWDVLFMVDSNGIIVTSTYQEEIGRHIREEPQSKLAFEAAMRDEIYDSDLIVSEETGKPAILFAAPIRSEKEPGRPIVGAVVGNFVWYVVLELLGEVPAETYVHLFNRNGILIGDRPERKENILKEDLARHSGIANEMVQGNEEVSGIFDSPYYHAKGALLAVGVLQRGYLGYKGKRWGLSLETPRSIVFAPVYRMAQRIAFLIAVLMAALTGIIYFITKQIVKPIEDLTKTVGIVATGNLRARAKVTTTNEIGLLANAFNQMTDDLHKTTVSRDELVEEVEQRKLAQEELKKAYGALQENQEAIRESEEQLQRIFNQASDGIIIVDAETKKIFNANQAMCAMLGYSIEEVQSLGFMEILPKENLHEVIAKFDDLVRAKSGLAGDISVQRKDGSVFYADISGSTVLLAGRKCEMGIFRDVTERSQIEKAKSNLIRDISHSLKSPIAAAEMALDAASKGIRLNNLQQVHNAQQIALKNIRKFRKDINNIVEMYSLDMGQRGREKKDISLKGIIQEILDEVRVLIDQKGLKLELDVPSEAEYILAGAREIKTLLSNVIDNAIKFTEKGTIAIRTQSKDQGVEITIKDTGCGIGPEVGTKVFERFYKRHAAVEGTGVGLPICRQIVALYGGTIDIISEGLGKGTTAIITLLKT